MLEWADVHFFLSVMPGLVPLPFGLTLVDRV